MSDLCILAAPSNSIFPSAPSAKWHVLASDETDALHWSWHLIVLYRKAWFEFNECWMMILRISKMICIAPTSKVAFVSFFVDLPKPWLNFICQFLITTPQSLLMTYIHWCFDIFILHDVTLVSGESVSVWCSIMSTHQLRNRKKWWETFTKKVNAHFGLDIKLIKRWWMWRCRSASSSHLLPLVSSMSLPIVADHDPRIKIAPLMQDISVHISKLSPRSSICLWKSKWLRHAVKFYLRS